MNLVYLMNLIEYKIGSVEIAGIAMIGIAMISTRHFIKEGSSLKILFSQKEYLLLLLFMVVSLFPFMIYRNYSFFSTNGFFLSYSKLIIYMISFIIVPQYLYQKKDKLFKLIKLSITIMSIYGIYQFIAYYLNLPYYHQFTMTSYGFFRITSVFKEPSYFVFVVIQYLFLRVRNVKLNVYENLAIFCASILTFSFTVYGVLIFGVLIIYILNQKNKLLILKGFAICAILFGIIYLFVPLIQIHINDLFSFKPSSATNRVFGGMLYSFSSPIMGIGFGNFEAYYQLTDANKFRIFTDTGQVNNIIFSIRLSSGLFGVIIFQVFLLIRYWKTSKKYLIIFLFSFFGWGHFNTASFFYLLMLLEIDRITTLNESQVSNQISILKSDHSSYI